jgi:O-acetyl-ADP-ribose deacetylase (regulator of RNase III)
MIHQTADAIVIPTNCYLVAVDSEGVDAAVRRAAGPAMAAECNDIGQCDRGKAAITSGGQLAVKHVIHTVPRSWKGGNQGEEEALESCYRSSIEVAAQNGVSTLAFLALGLGYLKFPPQIAADVAARTVCRFLRSHQKPSTIRLVFTGADVLQTYAESFERELSRITTIDELQHRYDVFISFKSIDLVHARRVYDYLSGHGLKTFMSAESIDEVGDPGYVKIILGAIDRSTHMVVVTSDAAHICTDLNPDAKWVEEERTLYLADLLAGRKKGNLLTVVAEGCAASDLPLDLRSRQVIELCDEGLVRILGYLTSQST